MIWTYFLGGTRRSDQRIEGRIVLGFCAHLWVMPRYTLLRTRKKIHGNDGLHFPQRRDCKHTMNVWWFMNHDDSMSSGTFVSFFSLPSVTCTIVDQQLRWGVVWGWRCLGNCARMAFKQIHPCWTNLLTKCKETFCFVCNARSLCRR